MHDPTDHSITPSARRRTVLAGAAGLAAPLLGGLAASPAQASTLHATPRGRRRRHGRRPVLQIAEQGVFAAGGTVQQTPGTFDPIKGQMAPAGQTRHSDHASVSATYAPNKPSAHGWPRHSSPPATIHATPAAR